MIDKLELTTNKIKDDAIKNLASHYEHSMPRDKNYKYCHVFKLTNNHIITIKHDPHFKNSSFYSLSVNPSKFPNLASLNKLIYQVSEDNFNIQRIDHAADIEKPITEIADSVKIDYKRNRSDYKNGHNLTGIEMGSKLDSVVIYDKAFELSLGRKYKLIEGLTPNILTRIEIRQKFSKVPFRNFKDLINYLNINPFKSLKFYKTEHKSITKDLDSYKHFKLIQTISDSGCLHGAIKKLNKSNNFFRSNKYLIRNIEIENKIENTYKSNLIKFFGG